MYQYMWLQQIWMEDLGQWLESITVLKSWWFQYQLQ